MKALNRLICAIVIAVVAFVLCFDKLDAIGEYANGLLNQKNQEAGYDDGAFMAEFGMDGLNIPGQVDVYDTGGSYVVFGNLSPKEYLDFVWRAYVTLGKNNGSVYESGEELRDEYYPAFWDYSLLNESKNTFVYKLGGDGTAFMLTIRYYPSENDRYARGAVNLRLVELGKIHTAFDESDAVGNHRTSNPISE
jgi:hypothetical protein